MLVHAWHAIQFMSTKLPDVVASSNQTEGDVCLLSFHVQHQIMSNVDLYSLLTSKQAGWLCSQPLQMGLHI